MPRLSVSHERMRNWKWHRTKIHLNVPHGGKTRTVLLYISKLLLSINRTEWMKGICHIWSRGRHFSPSLPGNRYLKLSSQKRPPGRNLGENRLVRSSGTASRGTALLAFLERMRRFVRAEVLTIFVGRNINLGIKEIPQIVVYSREQPEQRRHFDDVTI